MAIPARLRSLARPLKRATLKALVPPRQARDYERVRAASLRLMRQGAGTTGIVFSMDRAMQLHALLGSYRDNVENGARLTIIYRTTSDAHEAAYREVLAEFPDLVEAAVRQDTREAFRGILIDVLRRSSAEHVFFLVDDNLFIRRFDLGAVSAQATAYCVPSLRMGAHIARSYGEKKRQPRPRLFDVGDEATAAGRASTMLAWFWGDGEMDWGYPLSVDGHIFQRQELLAMCEAITFDSPNTFEGNLQAFRELYRPRLGLCFDRARLLNIPFNRVQTDSENLHGSVHQDDMLARWREGYRIDRASYYGIVNASVHEEMPLRLVSRHADGALVRDLNLA